MAKEKGFLGEWDEDRECHVLEEEPLLDEMEPLMARGGVVADHHAVHAAPVVHAAHHAVHAPVVAHPVAHAVHAAPVVAHAVHAAPVVAHAVHAAPYTFTYAV